MVQYGGDGGGRKWVPAGVAAVCPFWFLAVGRSAFCVATVKRE